MKCPHCGKEIETQQKRAAESRWSSMTKAERAAEQLHAATARAAWGDDVPAEPTGVLGR